MKPFLILLWTISAMLSAETRIFSLCEGNFGTPNASLWSINESGGEAGGPLVWDENTNPLGDVGQSMTIVNNEKLYLIMNNSHSIEILNLMGESQSYSGSIPLPAASPRYLVANSSGSTGYVSCWNLSGIVVIDLNTDTISDTILVGGMPEMMVIHDEKMYATIAMNSDWSTSNRVISVDLATNTVADSFTVVPGPTTLLLKDESLFVASTYYDESWNTYAGNSKINLTSGEVLTYDAGLTFDYGLDLVQVGNDVYRIYNNGIAPLNDDLSINADLKIGDFPGLYSVNAYNNKLYFGLTDYVAPDNMYKTNEDGVVMSEYNVGALPGSFAFYTYGTESVDTQISANQFSIMSNFPNPFNPKTFIQFSVETQTMTSLQVFNMNGSLVETLIEPSKLKVGDHLYQWNAKNHSSGIYFAILNMNGQTHVQKMSLIK